MIRVAPVLIAIVLLLQLVPVAVPAVAPAKADEDGAGVVDDMGATGRAWDPWWNANWSYRKPIDVNNSINRFTLNEFQVPINLTWTNGMAADYRDIRFVRDFMEKEPWEAESWFYGEVQDTEERLVIKISVNSANQYIEVFVASSNLSSMTGLLAELSSDVMGKVKGGGPSLRGT